MSFASKYNRANGKFSLSTAGFEFKKLYECYANNGPEHVYTIGAIFINTKNQYGPNPIVAVHEGYYIGLPTRLCDDCTAMLNDETTISEINRGLCGFTIYQYSSHGKTCYGIRWVDINPTSNSKANFENLNQELCPPF